MSARKLHARMNGFHNELNAVKTLFRESLNRMAEIERLVSSAQWFYQSLPPIGEPSRQCCDQPENVKVEITSDVIPQKLITREDVLEYIRADPIYVCVTKDGKVGIGWPNEEGSIHGYDISIEGTNTVYRNLQESEHVRNAGGVDTGLNSCSSAESNDATPPAGEPTEAIDAALVEYEKEVREKVSEALDKSGYPNAAMAVRNGAYSQGKTVDVIMPLLLAERRNSIYLQEQHAALETCHRELEERYEKLKQPEPEEVWYGRSKWEAGVRQDKYISASNYTYTTYSADGTTTGSVRIIGNLHAAWKRLPSIPDAIRIRREAEANGIDPELLRWAEGFEWQANKSRRIIYRYDNDHNKSWIYELFNVTIEEGDYNLHAEDGAFKIITPLEAIQRILAAGMNPKEVVK